MEFRHEIKFEINYSDLLIIRQRLGAVAYPDPHTINGSYFIRSLYFDNIADKALMDKVNGVSKREKFRIRYYNDDISIIHLEKKSKFDYLGNKQSAPLTAEQVERIIAGDIKWMLESEFSLVRELYSKMTTEGLAPKTIVDYNREPFIYPAGNVRVTIDYNVRSSMRYTDFLNSNCVTLPVSDSIILEVKWDGFMPDLIKDAVALENRREGAFSKYATSRIYG